MTLSLKDTLNLPKTNYPMRGNLPQKEPVRQKHWAKQELYKKKQSKINTKKFVIHDGPPFTNGNLHMGHALNKTLKDIILRYKAMQGFSTPYIPGWDCHGLPIEYKVSKEFQKKKQTPSAVEIRTSCDTFSEKYISIQRAEFQRLGIFADWSREYKTKNPSYEATILETFAQFVEKGLVYRSKKPVYWSIPCQTALAEAEIEYQAHQSTAVYVRFPIENSVDFGLPENSFVVIWTTTPWTLPANLAITLNPEFLYCAIKVGNLNYLCARDLLNVVSKKCGWGTYQEIKCFHGHELKGLITKHPFIERQSPLLLADYVTIESGTGFVHTAPGHGLEDYQTGIKNDLPIYCPLNDHACYLDDGQIPKELVGLSTLETKGQSRANLGVLKLIQNNGSLVGSHPHTHSYPHCWRSKTPVIFRAMDQWFISLDKDNIRSQAIDSIKDINFIPKWGGKRIEGFIQNRPDWCVSRQRTWGVPIPAFYDQAGQAYLTPDVIRGIAEKVRKHGTDIWFSWTPSKLLEGISLPKEMSPTELNCGSDTLDVWIDSGCSHRSVLKNNPDLKWPADLYLEGSDQHRGWFQSSLWTGIIADKKAPYRSILTHGFIVKEDGTKLSKSDPNNKPLMDWIKIYGADIIRLWIASQDYRGDVPLSENIIKNVTQAYRSIRNNFRFQIGNLFDYDPKEHFVDLNKLSPIDQWALHQTTLFAREVEKHFEEYEFHKAYQKIINFINNTLSSTYHDILKDRLYTYSPNDPLRRSSQTTIHQIFEILTKLLSPILPFTTDEAWSYFKQDQEICNQPIFLETGIDFANLPIFETAYTEIEQILNLKNNRCNELLEALRQEKRIGQSLDAKISFRGSPRNKDWKCLKKYYEFLPELLGVSQVELCSADLNLLETNVQHADGIRCPRSWRWVPELFETSKWGAVSSRCKKALEDIEYQVEKN